VRILLVEDNAMIGNAVYDHLRSESWTVDWTMCLASAIDALESNFYNVIVLDLRLPDGSGLDLLHRVSATAEPTPVIIMTAYDQLTDRIQGISIGAVDYIVKPFALSQLVARLRNIVAGKHSRTSHTFSRVG
jgi:two-component system OmpR family response regulator